ncbi:unnamed protein product [Effrenium voratum]|uniref:Uncharacterized protein n=1 Tax=Effrenium voratum TaxID=2562239 RepID=A0AA36I2B7_9DINO|nr:unnamed protein product [Effrenium voratum]
MPGIIHDQSSSLFVLHCERLEIAELFVEVSGSCQCHWYVGEAHHASPLFTARQGQSIRLDFCTFVVADTEASEEVKLTIATEEGEHLAVHFGQLAELGSSQQFARRVLQLRNVQGTVATAILFCALQQRWTVPGQPTRQSGETVTVGPEDAQAAFVLQHIFPEDKKDEVKDDLGSVATERKTLEAGDAEFSQDKEGERTGKAARSKAEKAKRRSVRESRRSKCKPEGPEGPELDPKPRDGAEQALPPEPVEPPEPANQPPEPPEPPQHPAPPAQPAQPAQPAHPAQPAQPAPPPPAPATSAEPCEPLAADAAPKARKEASYTSHATSPTTAGESPKLRPEMGQEAKNLFASASEASGEEADSEQDLPLPSYRELVSEEAARTLGRGRKAQPVQAEVHRGSASSSSLWCRAQRAYAEDRARQCRRFAEEGDSDSSVRREKPPELEDEDSWKSDTPSNEARARPDAPDAAPIPCAHVVQSQGRWFRVAACAVSIRRRPQVDAPLAGELPSGEVFQAVSSTTADSFTFLELSRGRGWVFSDARVQPVLVIDDTGATPAQSSRAERTERRPRASPRRKPYTQEAEAEPEPSCSPRQKPQAKPSPGPPEAKRARPEAKRALAAPEEVPRRASEPTPQVEALLHTISRTSSPRGKEACRGPQPVRAKHSLASLEGAAERSRDRACEGERTEGCARRSRSAEASRSLWDFRSAWESLEERQRLQAALLKVALRVHPEDMARVESRPSSTPPARRFFVPREVRPAEEAKAAAPSIRPVPAPMPAPLSCQFLAALAARGQRPEAEVEVPGRRKVRWARAQSYGLADIMLRERTEVMPAA